MKKVKLFEEFTFSQNLNEAFKSRLLGSLVGKGKLAPAIYNATKLALDKIEDGDLITTTPELARKALGGNKITLYISDVKKKNPYADQDEIDMWLRTGRDELKTDPTEAPGYFIEGGGVVIAALNGDNEFLYITKDPRGHDEYHDGKYKSDYRLVNVKNKNFRDERSYGIGKGSGEYGKKFGLTSLKKVADVSDRAVVIDIDALEKRLSTKGKIELRASQKDGALKYSNPYQIIAANKERYRNILNDAAAKLPLAEMAKDAVDSISKQIEDAVSKSNKAESNDIVIGADKKGNQVTTDDAARLSDVILGKLRTYSEDLDRQERSIKQYGAVSNFAKVDYLEYSRWFKKAIKKIETFDYSGFGTRSWIN